MHVARAWRISIEKIAVGLSSLLLLFNTALQPLFWTKEAPTDQAKRLKKEMSRYCLEWLCLLLLETVPTIFFPTYAFENKLRKTFAIFADFLSTLVISSLALSFFSGWIKLRIFKQLNRDQIRYFHLTSIKV